MHATDITGKDFEALVDREGIVVLDWWADWCAPCRTFAPLFEAAAARHPDIAWAKVDVEAEPALASAFGIRSIPTLMVFRDGLPVSVHPGVLPTPALEALVARVRALDMGEVLSQVAASLRGQRSRTLS